MTDQFSTQQLLAALAARLRPEWSESSILTMLKTRQFCEVSDEKLVKIVLGSALDPTKQPTAQRLVAALAAHLRPEWSESSILTMLKTRQFCALSDQELVKIVLGSALDPTAKTPKALLHTIQRPSQPSDETTDTARPAPTRQCAWCGKHHSGPDRLKCNECAERHAAQKILTSEEISEILASARRSNGRSQTPKLATAGTDQG